MPPATTISDSLVRIDWAPEATACRLDAHALLIVYAGTASGRPACAFERSAGGGGREIRRVHGAKHSTEAANRCSRGADDHDTAGVRIHNLSMIFHARSQRRLRVAQGGLATVRDECTNGSGGKRPFLQIFGFNYSDIRDQ